MLNKIHCVCACMSICLWMALYMLRYAFRGQRLMSYVCFCFCFVYFYIYLLCICVFNKTNSNEIVSVCTINVMHVEVRGQHMGGQLLLWFRS